MLATEAAAQIAQRNLESSGSQNVVVWEELIHPEPWGANKCVQQIRKSGQGASMFPAAPAFPKRRPCIHFLPAEPTANSRPLCIEHTESD
jgi:hypothetical protein